MSGARVRLGALAVAALCAVPGLASAQQPDTLPAHRPALVRYGKWAALGAAAGFLYLGATTHQRADRDYDALLGYCRGGGPCSLGADGRYANPTAEALYGKVRDNDRLARTWLVGGQVALLASAALFIVDLKNGSEPRNIPFSPYVAAGRYRSLFGLRIAWGAGRR